MKTVSRSYAKDLGDLVDMVFRDIAKEVVPKIGSLVKENDEMTSDAVGDDIDTIIRKLKAKYVSPKFVNEYKRTSSKTGGQTSALNKVQTKQQLSSIGINIFQDTPSLNRLLRRFTARNTRLIKTIPDEILTDVGKLIESAVASGIRVETLQAQILARDPRAGVVGSSEYRKAKNRASVIARDQVLTFSSQLSKARQQENGIDRFIWRTVGDERVRHLHAGRDGKEYSWETGAGAKDPYPGSGIQCRCSPEPVL